MSWETFVVGSVCFKEGVEKAKLDEAKEELESALETNIKYDEKYKKYKFEDVNWGSHVKGEEIKAAVEKYKDIISCFVCSLYYLSEADETILLEQEGGEVENVLI